MQIRHHYVPQFYLKRFSDPSQPDYVFAYTRGKAPFKTHTQRVAVERNFYTVNLEETGEKSDQFEKMFARLEGQAAPLFNRLANESSFTFTKEERGLLSLFIVQLYNRGPALRRKQNDFQIECQKKLIQFAAADKDRFEETTRNAGVRFETQEEFEQTRQRILDFDRQIKVEASGGEGFFMTLLLELSKELTPLVFYKRWEVLETSTADTFITSDSPVTLYIEDWSPKIGKGFLNSSVVLPISPLRCLFLSNDPTTMSIKLVRINRQQVLKINRNTMMHAYQRIFSHTLHYGIQKAFDKTKTYQSDQTMDIQIRTKPD